MTRLSSFLFLSTLIWSQTAPKPAPPVPSVKDLKFPPLRQIQIPNVEILTLPNGMKLYLLEDHELPIINATARVRTGNLFDPPDKIGLATITGMVMRTGGTQSKTGDELDVELENIAATVESRIDETSATVSFSTLKENTDEVLGTFRDVLTEPQFRQDKIDLAKSQLRSSIARRNDDAHGIAEREFDDTIYGKQTPYGWSMEYATVDRITRDDLTAFYQRYFFPSNVMLAVWGDFNAGEMRSKIENAFVNWRVTQPAVPAFPPVRKTAAPGVYLASKNDVTQTFFSIGHLGGELRDKDFPALEVMADILGGGFRSRLFQRVRTRMGNAYEIGADWGANYDHPGIFQISGSTKSATTVETIKAIQEEVEKIRTTEVTDDELNTAKQTALNSLVFAFDTKAKTLGRVLTYEYYGYPKDFIQQYQKGLSAVTKADILRVAKQRLDPAAFTIVAVGNPQDFGKSLESLGGPVTPIDLTIPEAKAEAPIDPASAAKGAQLLQRAQQASGGPDKIAAVRDYSDTAEFQINAGAGGMRVRQTDRWVAPGHFRQDSELPAGKVSAYLDNETQDGWIATPQGSGPLAGAQLKQVQGDLFRLYFRLLLSDRFPGRTLNGIDDHTIEIRDAASGEVARLEIDPATGLPRKVHYESVVVAGAPVPVEDEYADFQEVSGIKIPMRISISQAGQKFADVTLSDYKINTGLNAHDLEKRP
jgi:predicted Zn-dependent peptidase